jgi:hypothetical protein
MYIVIKEKSDREAMLHIVRHAFKTSKAEQDHVTKLQIHTSVTVLNGLVINVHQSYFVDGSSKDKASNLFRSTLGKLKKRYGKPEIERTSYARWENSLQITLTNNSSENITAIFRLPVAKGKP